MVEAEDFEDCLGEMVAGAINCSQSSRAGFAAEGGWLQCPRPNHLRIRVENTCLRDYLLDKGWEVAEAPPNPEQYRSCGQGVVDVIEQHSPGLDQPPDGDYPRLVCPHHDGFTYKPKHRAVNQVLRQRGWEPASAGLDARTIAVFGAIAALGWVMVRRS